MLGTSSFGAWLLLHALITSISFLPKVLRICGYIYIYTYLTIYILTRSDLYTCHRRDVSFMLNVICIYIHPSLSPVAKEAMERNMGVFQVLVGADTI